MPIHHLVKFVFTLDLTERHMKSLLISCDISVT